MSLEYHVNESVVAMYIGVIGDRTRIYTAVRDKVLPVHHPQ